MSNFRERPIDKNHRRSTSQRERSRSRSRSRSNSKEKSPRLKYRIRLGHESHPPRSNFSPNRRERTRSPSYSYRNPTRRIHDAPRNKILGIFGLSRRANERDLYDLYGRYRCRECRIIIDRQTGEPKGYGFVYFESVSDAERAKEETHGKMILDRPIRVDFSIGERPAHNYDTDYNHGHPPYRRSLPYPYSQPNHQSSRFPERRYSDYHSRHMSPNFSQTERYRFPNHHQPPLNGHHSYRSRRSPTPEPRRQSRSENRDREYSRSYDQYIR